MNLDVLVVKTDPDPKASMRGGKGAREGFDVGIAALASSPAQCGIFAFTRRAHGRGPEKASYPAARWEGRLPYLLDDVPGIFRSVAEFAAGHAGAEAEGTDADGIVFEGVCKVILALGHGTDEDTYALFGTQIRDIVPNTNDLGVEAEGDLATIRGQMVSNWILDDFEQFLLGIHGSDGQFVKQLDHETCKTLEGPRDSDCGIDLNEDPLSCVNVYL